MINMMYLVLLALLAMNVSAEIVNAFENIKVKLNRSAVEAKTNATDFISAMKAEICVERTLLSRKSMMVWGKAPPSINSQ